jgi:hypothetical protein
MPFGISGKYALALQIEALELAQAFGGKTFDSYPVVDGVATNPIAVSWSSWPQ